MSAILSQNKQLSEYEQIPETLTSSSFTTERNVEPGTVQNTRNAKIENNLSCG